MNGIKTAQDVLAIESIPLSERKLPQSTYEALKNGLSLAPEDVALSFIMDAEKYDRPITFTQKQLLNKINQTANAFFDLGIRPGDVVSILLPNCPDNHFCFWAAEAAGIANPINPLLEAEQIAEIMKVAKTNVLVTLAPLPGTDIWHKVETIRGKIPSLKAIVQVDLSEYLPFMKSGIVKVLTKVKTARSKGPEKILNLRTLLSRQSGKELKFHRTILAQDIASYFHTGGTTGTPKLAQHTHLNEVFDAWAASQNCHVTTDNVFMCGLPLFHVNGVIVTGLMPWMYGASVVMATPQGYRGKGVIPNFWKIVEHYKVSFFSAVPAVYATLLQYDIGKLNVRSLQFAISGAAALPKEVCSTFEERTGVKILEGYGLTEGTCVSAVNPAFGERRNGSVGFRLPYQQMKCVLLDQNKKYIRDCNSDEIGEIVVRGPNVFPGYLKVENNPFLAASEDDKPWLLTGDLGRQDRDGYFWITGRKKELIIRGGHNIDPRLIEEPIQTHSAVLMVAAVGRPDPRVGEVPVAYVSLKPGQTTTVEELLSFASTRITERAAVPKKIVILDALPLTAVGKIYKPALLNLQIEEVYSDELKAIPGIKSFSAEFKQDSKLGLLTEVNVLLKNGLNEEEVAQEIRKRLGQYTISYALTCKLEGSTPRG